MLGGRPTPKIFMNVKSLKCTRTHSQNHTENMRGVYEEIRAHWVFMGVILWEMLH